MRATSRVAPPRESVSCAARSLIRSGPSDRFASTSNQVGGSPVSRSIAWPMRSTMRALTCRRP